MKLPRGSVLIVASHNPGKVREIKALLGPHGIEPVSAGDLDLPEPEETGATFAANAELKARAAADAGHHPALADDSGLWVNALNGEPGIYSARWAGPAKDFAVAMARVEKELLEKNGARFLRQIRLRPVAGDAAWRDQRPSKAKCMATSPFRRAGSRGFGYDPDLHCRWLRARLSAKSIRM